MSISSSKRTSSMTIGQLFKVVGGGTPSTANPKFWSGSTPWVTSADLDNNLGMSVRKSISREAINSSAANLVPAGSVIVATRVSLGKVGVATTDLCFSQDCQGVIVDSKICDTKFAAHQLKLRVQAFKHISRGTTIAGVTKQQLLDVPFDLPPLPDQRRIVAEIEKQFTRLDAAVAGLQRAKANLKRYRASVLKAACEGKLVPTEAELAKNRQPEDYESSALRGKKRILDFESSVSARQKAQTRTPDSLAQTPGFETGSLLLERILVERRKKWSGHGNYKEPVAPDTAGLSELPKGWTWSSLDQLRNFLRNGISAKPNAENGLPILRISAVRPLSVNLAEIRYLKAKVDDYLDYTLSQGDLLFTRYNGNPELVGVCGVVPVLTSPLVHPDKLIRCKLVPNAALPTFVAIMANVGESRNFLAKRVRTTAGQVGISGSDLKGLPIPLPPLAEQKRIVAEVERRLSVVNELEATVTANRTRATRLRQAILHRAFNGEL